jgi:hypothetical protein
MVGAVSQYAEEVRNGAFPTSEHSFSIDPAELAEFLAGLEKLR